jgi:ABC-type thiamine transport system ATPase subunit
MRISAIHTRGVGPLGTQDLAFRSDWSGEIAPTILFSGPNGCGKSTLLRGVAMLWSAFGQWLQTGKAAAWARTRLRPAGMRGWEGMAVVLEQAPFGPAPLVLFVGNEAFAGELQARYPSAGLIGEQRPSIAGRPGGRHRLRVEPGGEWFAWADAQRRLVDWSQAGPPNVVHMDAEARRWVAPTRGEGQIVADDPVRRWRPTYEATEDWAGQLEQSMLGLKAAAPARFDALLAHMNAFLVGKRITGGIIPGANRLPVQVGGGSGPGHLLDDLSSGEHQVLIQLYMVGRWLEPGGIVLIDEPDLHLHPSLIPGFLSKLEQMVAERDGQLLLTSHLPQVWDRYEARGLRVALGSQP